MCVIKNDAVLLTIAACCAWVSTGGFCGGGYSFEFME